ncbi:MAG TPA: PASTA domain-containing protein [Gaiellaceae bacterium]|nr:PASTA domain-containing protein [Gaiellaceae bacterium]
MYEVETELYEPGPPPALPPEEPPPSRELWPWLLVLLVLVLAVAGAAYYISNRDDQRAARGTTTVAEAAVPLPAPQAKKQKAKPVQPTRVALPRLIGLKAPEALSTLRKLQLTGEVRGAFSTKPPGVVIAQAPAPGAKLAKNASVQLQVSKGPRDVPVPDLVGQQRDDAVATLKAAGLKTNLASVPSPQPEGEVVAQHPAAGTKAPSDSAVRLNVSSGSPPEAAKEPATAAQPAPQPKPAQKPKPTPTQKARPTPKPTPQQPAAPVTVTVPDLVGGTLASARSQLRAEGLVTEIRRVPSQEPKDTVTGQSPGSGTTAKKGDHVFLTISLGPTEQQSTAQQGTQQPTEPAVPNVVGEDQATAAADLRAAGFKVAVLDQPTDDPAQDGIVVDQSPAATTTAAAGSTVTITVARASG